MRFARPDRKELAMAVGDECCCGLDVHAKAVVACLVTTGCKALRTFVTRTDELWQLGDWLRSLGGRQVAIESTGGDGKPVCNMLESRLTVSLVNARHLKAVPGRQTAVRDREWWADLWRHGLLRARVIPPPEIRALREVVRDRQRVVREPPAVANRIPTLSESAHIKLGQVASEGVGLSGRRRLGALAAGETDAETRAELAQGQWESKKAEVRRVLAGCLTHGQRWVLREGLTRVAAVAAAQARVEARLSEAVATCAAPFVPQAVELLKSIPGVGQGPAPTSVAALGVEMSRFPSARHLASWAGGCSGTHEAAGTRKGGQPPKGKHSVRTSLVEAAWAATHGQGTCWQAKEQRLVKRMPKQKAWGAIAQRLLGSRYHLLSGRVA